MKAILSMAAASVLATAAMGLSGAASASSVAHTWHFNYQAVPGVGDGGSANNSKIDGSVTPRTYKSNNDMLTEATGWYYDGSTLDNGNQYLRHWNGLSFDNHENAPWHGIDNHGADELVVFEFEEAISLEHFQFGYAREEYSSGHYYGQADATILYRDPAKAEGGIGNLESASWSGLTSATNYGYSVAGHFGDVAQGVVKDISSVTAGIYSKVWAIGAYISALSGPSYGGVGTGWKDAFKLKSISGVTNHNPPRDPNDPNSVPVPATFALLALGGFILRRKTAQR